MGGWLPPPYPETLTAYPTQREGMYVHIFFLKMTPKGWGNDYLDPLPGEFERFKYSVMETGKEC